MNEKNECNFKQYDKPKKAVYFMSGNKYEKDAITGLYGWSKIILEVNVIGEDDTHYITEIKKYRNCDIWDKDYKKNCMIPLGFHKSRLIKWKNEQLKLF